MPLVRKPGTGARGKAPAAAGVAEVRQALVSGTVEQRWSAARAAAEVPELAAACGEALARETDARVREALLTSLVRMATRDSIAAVLPCLRSDDAQLRGGAMGALAALQQTAWPAVALLLQDSDAHIRILACELARNMTKEEAVPLVCNLLDAEQDANVCAAAVETLAEIGGPAALPALQRCAERFRDTPFLQFSIEIAADRIRAQQSAPSA